MDRGMNMLDVNDGGALHEVIVANGAASGIRVGGTDALWMLIEDPVAK